MQLRILAASPSLSRRLWYRSELSRRGCEVQTVDNGLSCVNTAAVFRPHVLIIEPFVTWGGSDGVLAVREHEPSLRSVPVMVIDVQRNAAQTYRIGAYELAGYWKWSPTADDLVKACHRAVEDSSLMDILPTHADTNASCCAHWAGANLIIGSPYLQ